MVLIVVALALSYAFPTVGDVLLGAAAGLADSMNNVDNNYPTNYYPIGQQRY